MLTQDQLNTIGGESVFEFEANIGISDSWVNVSMSYEYDSFGTYNETIKSVSPFHSEFPLMDYLEESTIDDLCILGCKLLKESKEEVY